MEDDRESFSSLFILIFNSENRINQFLYLLFIYSIYLSINQSSNQLIYTISKPIDLLIIIVHINIFMKIYLLVLRIPLTWR